MSKELTTPIEISKVPYYVKYGTMSMIEFGKMTGKRVGEIGLLSQMQLEELYQLYYSGLVAGCKLAGVPCLTFDEFILECEKDESILTRLQSLRDQNNNTEGN